MVVLRLLLACLVALAIPLQGFAAAAMVVCGAASHAFSSHNRVRPSHTHTVGDVQASHDATHAKQQSSDACHKCGVCASCCHSMAISTSIQVALITPLSQAGSTESWVPLASRPVAVPEKPPRV